MDAVTGEHGSQLFIDKSLSMMLKEVASIYSRLIGDSDGFASKRFLKKASLRPGQAAATVFNHRKLRTMLSLEVRLDSSVTRE